MPGLSDFLHWLEVDQGRAANTVSAYRSDLVAYEQWVGDVRSATEQAVQDYVGHLSEQGRAPASVRRALVAIRALHRYLGIDAAAAVGAPDVPPAEPDVLGDDEVERLLRAAEGDAVLDRRDHAMVAVLVGGGLRISELVGLDLADLGDVGDAGDADEADDGERTVAVVGHGDRDRIVELDDRAAVSLARWLAPTGRPVLTPGRAATAALFVNARGGRLSRQGAWAIVHARGQLAGLGDRVTPQVLRNTYTARQSRAATLRTVAS